MRDQDIEKELAERRVVEGLISAQLVRCSPAFAEYLLRYNKHNYRTLPRASMLQLALGMDAQRFVANPADWVVIGREKKDKKVVYSLHNGQTRLHAAIRSGQTVDLFVVLCPEELCQRARDWMDGGCKRTFADTLAHAGIKYPDICARISRLIWAHVTYKGEKSRQTRKMERTEGLETFFRYAEGIQFSAKVTSCTPGIGVTSAYRTALAKAFYLCHPDRLEDFHRQFVTQHCDKLRTDHAAKLLAVYYRNAPHTGEGKVSTHAYYLHCEWAVVSFAERKEVRVLGTAEKAGDYLPLPH